MQLVRISISLLFLLQASSIFCAAELEVLIKSTKTVYYYGEPIELNFTLTNITDQEFALKISQHTFLNYYIEVYDQKNISIKERDDFFSLQMDTIDNLKKDNNNQAFKTLTLSSRQILGNNFDLLSQYQLEPGIYLIRGKFYPQTSYLSAKNFFHTPFIRLIVKENIFKEKQKSIEEMKDKEELKKILTPEDSVRTFFEAKIQKKWNAFFYVIDLRRLIKYFPVFYKSFKKAADEEKNSIVRDFKEYLQALNTEEKLLNYDIRETVIRKNEAICTVVTTSRFQEIFIKREYKFGLILKDHWYIYGYTVVQK
jgi:hypothetical protein